VHSFTVSVDIAAPPARVWRALCDPAEVVQWDSGVEEALDAPPDYPQPGQHVRWRYANGLFRTLHDRPREVVPERKLSSELSLGFARFHETYTLEPLDGSTGLTTGGGTRLSAAMNVWALLPLAGGLVERLYLGAQARRTVEASLQAIKRHCEEDQGGSKTS
jgi:uncharacterized protein YndB with AHSA1/START domain